jgi:6-phosphogluconolactonase
MYSYLASPDLAGQIDWGRVHVFWSDERCVPPDHGDSNYNMARQCLLDLVPISADNIHRVHGELDPLAAADAYELALRGFFGDARVLPCMDFILLGMGEDGHIASLFPGDAALDESRRWIVAVPHDRPPPPMVWRVTATLPFIRSARQVILIVSGASKAARVQQAHSDKADAPLLPVQRLREIEGELVWMLDRVAAGLE